MNDITEPDLTLSFSEDGLIRDIKLSKREYFAAKAMQGLIAGADLTITGYPSPFEDRLAVDAVLLADALLRALEDK